MNANVELMDFLREGSKDDAVFLSNVVKYDVGQLVYHELCLNSLSHSNTLEYHVNKMQNKIFREEMVRLSKLFAKENIKMVFLKGLSLAYDVYSDPDLRKSSDIDVLIDYKDILAIIEVLKMEGYLDSKTNKPVGYDDIVGYAERKNIDTILHFNPIYKISNLSGYVITIELHISIFSYLENKLDVMSGIVNDAVLQDFFGSNIYVLEIHDRLIHLLAHLSKDYFKRDLDHAFTSKELGVKYFDFKLLHDIALVISKYKNDIEWNIFLEKTSVYKKSNEIHMACRLVDHVYTGYFLPDVLSKLKLMAEREYEEFKSYPAMPPDDIGYLWLNPLGLLPVAVDLKIHVEVMLRCYSAEVIGEMLKKLPLNGIAFNNESSMFYIFEGCIRTGEGVVQSSIISTMDSGFDVTNLPKPLNMTKLRMVACGEITVNNKGVCVNLKTNLRKNSSVENLNFILEFVFCYSNYKYIDRFKDILPKIIFNLCDKGKLYFSSKNVNLDYTYEYEGEYCVDIKGDLIDLRILLSWDFLGINNSFDTEILFDIAMMFGNPMSFMQYRYLPKMEYLRKLYL